MSIQVTLTFANAAEMLAYFSGKAPSPAPTPKADAPAITTDAGSSRTAEAVKADAQSPKGLDFDKDVTPVLQAAHKKDKAKFGELMKAAGCADINAVKAKADAWPKFVEYANKIING